MAGLDDILAALPIDEIASKLGVDPATAKEAVTQGGGAILSGLQQNAATAGGSAAIEAALGKHADATVPASVDDVDTADGQKILQHVFGGKEQEVAQTLTQDTQTAGIDFGKLLPMLAPVVMGMLASGQKSQQSGAAQDAQGSGGGIGDLIGGLLGGGASPKAGGGFDIGGLLGGLLGGNNK
ncbi:MAG: DUF937 domain-containing protein [Microbacterium sp.]|uniref:DUF937 domain-containing protein n=1 Tax=Microbacterium sp. TaxID=51671 RepID=UPI001ACA9E07|nr:DUF937 domain-containing protein [Microbacterium sp.]MBN9176675.1 DUF937 domain-containing protein [Microbacterium sp.]